jgi:hypothetical protein
MTDTIRQRIIDAIKEKGSEVRRSMGYRTDIGKNIQIYRTQNISVPAMGIWPGTEVVTQVHGGNQNEMPIRVEGIMALGANDYHEMVEKIIGDIIEMMTGIKYVLDYSSGGDATNVAEPGDVVLGETSGAEAVVESFTTGSGSWGLGTAAGFFTLRRLTGEFEAEDLTINGVVGLAQTSGGMAKSKPETTTCGDLVEDIILAGAGREDYPESGEQIVGSMAVFNIIYFTVIGNPYSQPT